MLVSFLLHVKLSDDEMIKFKSAHGLKNGADLFMQPITLSNTFTADGKVYSLDDLTPFNVFAADAAYMEDGEMKPLPAPSTFVRNDGEDVVLIAKGPKEEIRSIDVLHGDGSVTYMEAVKDGVLATILPEMRDQDALKGFVMAHIDVSEGDSEGDGSDGDWRNLLEYDSPVEYKESKGNGEHRLLQAGCSSLRVIEVAIAYESSFCSDMGGAANANAAVQQIVSRASALYQTELCAKIEISHLESTLR